MNVYNVNVKNQKVWAELMRMMVIGIVMIVGICFMNKMILRNIEVSK